MTTTRRRVDISDIADSPSQRGGQDELLRQRDQLATSGRDHWNGYVPPNLVDDSKSMKHVGKESLPSPRASMKIPPKRKPFPLSRCTLATFLSNWPERHSPVASGLKRQKSASKNSSTRSTTATRCQPGMRKSPVDWSNPSILSSSSETCCASPCGQLPRDVQAILRSD